MLPFGSTICVSATKPSAIFSRGVGFWCITFVIGELALGNLRQRDLVLGALSDLPRVAVTTDDEVLHFIHQHALFGLGVGYSKRHLLAGVARTAGSTLWTRDKRLHTVAGQLDLTKMLFER